MNIGAMDRMNTLTDNFSELELIKKGPAVLFMVSLEEMRLLH